MHFQPDQIVHRLQTFPPDVWVKIGAGILAFILAVSLVRRVAKFHPALLAALFLIVGTVFFFQWVYERNEPKFLTAAVNRIAPFFPAKDSYGAKQNGPQHHPG